MNTKYDLNDFTLIPAEISTIESRTECNPYLEIGMLPLFAAPMGAVIDDKNWSIFVNNKIHTVIPRTVPLETRMELCEYTFVSLSLSEFEEFVEHNAMLLVDHYICVDLAQGAMKKLIDLCAKGKEKFGNRLVIMTGNIANPRTYYHYAKAGIDYVRCSVGNGSCCTTAANAAHFYPMGSLISEVAEIKKEVSKYPDIYKSVPKIIADGGFDSFDRIIKALYLGADYVMIGKIFAECEEACGDMFDEYKKNDSWTEEDKKYLRWDEYSGTYYIKLREYYGMSTKRAQKETGRKTLHTSEGISKWVYVNKTLPQWCENFVDYLRSAMSYANARTLDEFRKCERCFITEAARKSYYK